MRPKKRYILLRYNDSGNLLDIVRARYAGRFGADDLEKASLELISNSNGIATLRCNLECCKHLLETLASDDKFVTLRMSGTLKALRSRQDEIRNKMY